ncbi:tetratricopeptide repeat protein [Arenicella xantha]|uniref:Tetratricopeptide repeat protein n=1 Tax=Arenicella xantha TaxID=644221 RepID=A0A395JQA6_9GAMM|nr:tetratricopeptide repeat protein [Arenicella xantha]RBP53533.1 tetratricopeptide repeat protein [Arenicella xantha]
MHSLISRKSRRVIPRWRLASDNDALRYSEGNKNFTPLVLNSDLEKSYVKWSSTKSPDSAIELAIAFEAFGDWSSISREKIQSEFIQYGGCDIALKLMERAEATQAIQSNYMLPSSRDGIGAQLRLARNATRSQPLSSFAWLALARSYTILGLHSSKKCEQAIKIACQLSPSSRYVARVAVRYFIHRELPDRAIDVLAKSGRALSDPWLASALIASREIAQTPQKSVNRLLRLSNDPTWTTFSRSELLTGLASLEAGHGSDRTAKKLFNVAITDPTENALAQAQWFSNFHQNLVIPQETIDNTRAFEAMETRAFKNGNWGKVLESSRAWQAVEPFSKRPALNGSMVALSVLNDPNAALELMKPAYIANPTDQTVANNYAVSLVCSGQLMEASKIIKTAVENGKDTEIHSLMATTGLLLFRAGDTENGREFYTNARIALRKDKNRRNEFICGLYWAREEAIAGNLERSEQLITEAKSAYKVYKDDKLASAALKSLGEHKAITPQSEAIITPHLPLNIDIFN